MRILHVVSEFGNLGNGIVNVACDLIHGQSTMRHEVAVATAPGNYADLVSSAGARVYGFKTDRTSPLAVLRTRRALSRIVAEFGPDVIHCHNMTSAALTRTLRSQVRPALIATVHNEYQRGSRLMGLADRVVAVSGAVERAMSAKGVPPRKLRVVLNGVVGSPRRHIIPMGEEPDLGTAAIVTIGAVSPRKGSDIVLQAFSMIEGEFPAAALYFVGNRDWPDLEERFRARDWFHRVHFVGLDPEPQRYLQPGIIFVQASRREPLGLAVLEARQAGVAIIGSDADGIPEALDHGEAGILVPAGSVPDLAEALRHMLGSAECRAAYAERARSGMKKFRVEEMVRQYLLIYEEAVDGVRKVSA